VGWGITHKYAAGRDYFYVLQAYMVLGLWVYTEPDTNYYVRVIKRLNAQCFISHHICHSQYIQIICPFVLNTM